MTQKKKNKFIKNRQNIVSSISGIVLLLLNIFCYASEFTIPTTSKLHLENYSIDDGLSLSVVTAFAQTDDGFVWIGTQDGLNRFDGYDFKMFKRIIGDANALPDSYINSLKVDRKQRLWVATDKGLVFKNLKDAGFTRIEPYQKDKSLAVISIEEDIYGRIWGLTESGLFIVNELTNRFTLYEELVEQSILRSDKLRGLLSIGSNLYFSRGTCLYSIDLINLSIKNKCFDELQTSKGEFSIDSVASNGGEEIWLGSNGGLLRYNLLNQSVTHFHRDSNGKHRLSSNNVQSILIANNGKVWVGTRDGLNLFDPNRSEILTYKSNLVDKYTLLSDDIYALFEDSNGLIWIGTYGAGLHIWNPQSTVFNHYLTRSEVNHFSANNTIHAVTTDLLGNVWIGTYGSGLFRLNPERTEIERIQSSNPTVDLKERYILALHFDVYDNLWIGTRSGLLVFDPDSGFVTPIKTIGIDQTITTIMEDHFGNLWVGGDGVLTNIREIQSKIIDEEKFTVKNYLPLLQNLLSSQQPYVNTIHEDIDGNIWVGSISGLVFMDVNSDNQFLFQSDENNPRGLSNSFIQALYEDTQGTLWIGTADGLNKLYIDRDNLNYSYFEQFDEKHGFMNDSIYGISADEQQELWLSTNYGIVRFNPADKNTRHFTVSDGIQSNEFNIYASHKSADGEIFFGGINGVTSFYSTEISYSSSPGNLHLLDLKIGRDTIDRQQADSMIVLNDIGSFLSAKIVSINFSSPEKQRYRYRISGLKSDWNELDASRIINVFGLKSGSYSLDVQVKVDQQDWSVNELNIPILVSSGFLFSRWMMAVYILLSVFIIVFSVWYWRHIIERRNIMIKQELDVRRDKIVSLTSELDYTKEVADSSSHKVEQLQSKISWYNEKLEVFSRRDLVTNFYKKYLFEELVFREDKYLNESQQSFPEGCLITLSIRNYRNLVQELFLSNIESAIADFADLIREYFSGDDLICRWENDKVMILESGSFKNIFRKIANLSRLLKYRKFNLGNGKLIKLDVVLSLVPVPFIHYDKHVQNRVQACYLASELADYLALQNRGDFYSFQCVHDAHPLEISSRIQEGIESLIRQGFFQLKQLSNMETTE